MQGINRNHWITADLKRQIQVKWSLINGHHGDCLQMILTGESIDPGLIHVDTSLWRANINHHNRRHIVAIWSMLCLCIII